MKTGTHRRGKNARVPHVLPASWYVAQLSAYRRSEKRRSESSQSLFLTLLQGAALISHQSKETCYGSPPSAVPGNQLVAAEKSFSKE